MSICKAFNSHFLEFVDDVLTVVPNNKNVKTARFYAVNLITMNPVLLIKGWHIWITEPYEGEIKKGEFQFFLDKDYKSDIGESDHYNTNKVLDAIEPLRSAAQQMSIDNKKKIIKYIQNLCKLSKMYKMQV